MYSRWIVPNVSFRASRVTSTLPEDDGKIRIEIRSRDPRVLIELYMTAEQFGQGLTGLSGEGGTLELGLPYGSRVEEGDKP